MRWLKKLLSALLIYIGVFLPFIAVLQAITGYDYSAAYQAVTGVGGVELLASAVIKIVEAREERKINKSQQQKITEISEVENEQLETEADEP